MADKPRPQRIKPWITDPADRAYIETRAARIAQIEGERKRLQRQIYQREHKVWDHGGRERYLADTA